MECSQTAQSGRPRALGGGSRSDAVGADPGQSVVASWRPVIYEGSWRRIYGHPLKCSDSSRRSIWILQTAFLKKVVNLRVFFLNFSALFDEATGHRRNAGIRAGGHLRGHLGFAKHFPGALASTQGALWTSCRAAESLGNGFAVRKTDRLHFCSGI